MWPVGAHLDAVLKYMIIYVKAHFLFVCKYRYFYRITGLKMIQMHKISDGKHFP